MPQIEGSYALEVIVELRDGKLCGKVYTDDRRNVEIQRLPYETRKMILKSMRDFLNRWDKKTTECSYGCCREVPASRPLFGPERKI